MSLNVYLRSLLEVRIIRARIVNGENKYNSDPKNIICPTLILLAKGKWTRNILDLKQRDTCKIKNI